MNQLEKFRAYLQNKRRHTEDELARFLDLLKVGQSIVRYAEGAIDYKREQNQLLTRMERYSRELMSVTPVYA